MNKIEREHLFIEWMNSPIHPTIKASTLESYIAALKKSFTTFANVDFELDIFNYKILSEFHNFFNQIRQNERYDKFNKSNNGSYQALLKKYEKYLSEMQESQEKYVSKEDFLEWAVLKKRSYNPSWINIYVDNLKSLAFDLQENDDLKINLFDIDDANSFRIAEVKIRADKNFDTINQHSTQKSFSAALGRYSEFLASDFYLSRLFVKDLVEDKLIDEQVKTEIERTVLLRIGQSDFRRGIIRRDRDCLLCHIPYTELLRASHIKPWAKSTNQERLDLSNGFLLCANHDVLFDKGLISFDEQGNLKISSQINPKDYDKLLLGKAMNLNVDERQGRYLIYHRQEIFRK